MTASWPDAIARVVHGAPVLRGLPDSARAAIEAASPWRTIEAGREVFTAGESGDALFVVARGRIEVSALRRGDETPSVLRVAGPGDTIGEEPLLSAGATRHASARALEAADVVAIPAALIARGAARTDGDGPWDRLVRRVRRQALTDLLLTTAATRDLPESDRDLLLDAVVPRDVERGAAVYGIGDEPDAAWLVADGMVQLQTDTDGRVRVWAYLAAGDAFGDEDCLVGTPRTTAAIALGPTRLLGVPADALRTIVDRNPGFLRRLRRIATDRGAQQAAALAEADPRATQHVLRDVYRLQVARSLLVIDPTSCVRCGHCTWTCAEVHGHARLSRRGDKLVTAQTPDHASLLVVNSCQHCKNPVCMIDCPTGAIGRDPGGEVFVRAELCTGCGNCAKACPWDNIRLAPRPATRARVPYGPKAGQPLAEAYPWIADKCDHCRDYEGPACVQACPTGSIVRLDPAREVGEVAALLGGKALAHTGPRMRRAWAWWLCAPLVGAAIAVVSARAQGSWSAFTGPGRVGAWAGALGILLLLAHAWPKRWPRLWLRRRPRGDADRPRVRSRLRPLVVAHVVLGMATVLGVLAHAPLRLRADPAGSLLLAFGLASLAGILGAVAYAVVPARLARLEDRGSLPEDLPLERAALLDALVRDASGRSLEVKRVLAEIVGPYLRGFAGGLRFVASGRDLAQERARLVALAVTRIGPEAAQGEDLVRSAVRLRALGLRRAAHVLLRAFLPVHVVLAAMCTVLLLLHIVVMLGLP